MSDGGKGSARRPRAVSNEEYEQRWDAIFGRDKSHTSALEELVRINQELGLYDEPAVQQSEKPTAGLQGQDNSR